MERWTIGGLLETAAGYLQRQGLHRRRGLTPNCSWRRLSGVERIAALHAVRPSSRRPGRWLATGLWSPGGQRTNPWPTSWDAAYFRQLRLEVDSGRADPPAGDRGVGRPGALQTAAAPAGLGGLASGARPPGGSAPGHRRRGHRKRGYRSESGPGGRGAGPGDRRQRARRWRWPAANASLGRTERLWSSCASADLLDGSRRDGSHLVVSNPPYVRSGDIPRLAPDVRLFEPAGALDGGPDGPGRLSATRARGRPGPAGRAARSCSRWATDQAAGGVGSGAQAGFALVAVHKDLSRKDRMVEATLPGAPALTAGRPARRGGGRRSARRWMPALSSACPPTPSTASAARWDSRPGIRRLFAAKQRPPEQPVAVLFASVDAVCRRCPISHPAAAAVLGGAAARPLHLRGGDVGAAPGPGRHRRIRWGCACPDHPDAPRAAAILEMPLAATSANLTGRADARRLRRGRPGGPGPLLGGLVPSAPDTSRVAGRMPGAGHVSGVASTVVDLRPLGVATPPSC